MTENFDDISTALLSIAHRALEESNSDLTKRRTDRYWTNKFPAPLQEEASQRIQQLEQALDEMIRLLEDYKLSAGNW